MKAAIQQKIIAGFSIVFFVVIVFSVITFFNMNKLIDDSQKLKRTEEVLNKVEKIHVSVLQLETNSRGYVLLAGNQEFLDAFNKSMDTLRSNIYDFLNFTFQDTTINKDAKELAVLLEKQINSSLFLNNKAKNNFLTGTEIKNNLQREQEIKKRILFVIDKIKKNELEFREKSSGILVNRSNVTIWMFLVLIVTVFGFLGFCYYALIKDIKNRELAEIKLKNAATEILGLYNNAPCGYHTIDINGFITEINNVELKWLGYSREEVIGRLNFKNIVAPKDLPEFEKQFDLFKKTGSITDVELDLVRKNNTTFPVVFNAVAVFDAGGNFVMGNSTLFDNTERKAAASKLLYQSYIMNNASEAIIATDLNFNITTWNKAAEIMYGYKEQEVIGTNVSELLRTDFLTTIREEVIENILEKGGWIGEVKQYTKDGKAVPFLVSSSHIVDKHGKSIGFISISRDISERKMIEEEIKQSNDFLNAILEYIPNMVFVKDAKELRFVRFNKAGEELLGFAKEELIGKNDYDFFSKKEADFFTSKDRDVLKSNKMLDIKEEQIQTRLNGSRWLHTKKIPLLAEDGTPLFLLGISEDITERKQAEEKLIDAYEDLEMRVKERTKQLSEINETLTSEIEKRTLAEEKILESGKRYRALIEKSTDFVTLSDSAGKYFYVSPSLPKYFGYSEEMFYRLNCFDLICPKDLKKVRSMIDNIQEIPGAFATMEYRIVNKNGNYIWCEGTITNLLNDQSVAAIVMNFRDISERKNAEEKLKSFNEELELKVAERTFQLESVNKELEAFSYSVSHDLRAPLRAIDGFAKILEDDYFNSLDDEGKRLLTIVQQNAKKMGVLIDDLLSFSRLGKKEIQKSKIDMNELTERVVREINKLSINNRAEIIVRKLQPVMADYSMLSQVLINLIANAIKYSSNAKHPKIEIDSYEMEKEVVYLIKDNGVGFNMKYINKLFGVFQRLHSSEEFEGTGVGLAIVKRIITKHDGKVWAEAEINKGATFYFSLPKLSDLIIKQ